MKVCIIPARFNSSRFPGKLLALAGGKTVLERTFESALGYFDRNSVFIATDDLRIATAMQARGAQIIWTSPDCANGTERIAEAVEKTDLLAHAEIIVNLQGDHPCMDCKTIQAAISLLESDPAAAMSTAAAPIRSLEDFLSPHVVKVVVDKEDRALYFSRSPIPYAKEGILPEALQHIGLYCFRKNALIDFARLSRSKLQMQEDLEQLKALEMGWTIKVAKVDEIALGIDTLSDLAKLEELLCRSNTFSSPAESSPR